MQQDDFDADFDGEVDNLEGMTEDLLGTATLHARRMAAQWLERLALRKIPISQGFLDCFRWATGTNGVFLGIRDLLNLISCELADIKGTKEVLQIRKKVKGIIDGRQHSFCTELESLVETYRDAVDPIMRKSIIQICAKTRASLDETNCENIYENAKKRMIELFGVSDEGCELCEFIFLAQSFVAINGYFFRNRDMDNPSNWHILAVTLGISKSSIIDTVNELKKIGVIDIEPSVRRDETLRFNEKIVKIWNGTSSGNEELFCCKLEGKSLPLGAYSIPEIAKKHVIGLMQRNSDAPVNILLYGAPGTGKTAFVKSVAAQIKAKAWSVLSREQDGEGERRSSLMACISIASRSPNSFVLVDEAERLLDTRWSANGSTGAIKDKAWLNYFLERPGQRIIWITNQIEHIDKAVRRRFSFSIHFEELGFKERKNMWKTLLKENRILSWLTEEQYSKLAKNYDVPVAVIEKAILQAKDLGGKKEFIAVAECILSAHVTLDNNGVSVPIKYETSQEYSLEGITINGSPQDILENCRKLDAVLRSGTQLRPTSGNMLFYGVPGTGKTALAKFLGKELDRECLIMPGSKLFNMYVGNTEKNIAKAFAKAERDGDILVFDEVDSFLYSRDNTNHSWESSFVNEFLMQLEKCRGLCICTTNRREGLDKASMRRFSLKVEFTYAMPEQIEVLYNLILAPLASSPLSEKSKSALCRIQKLAPGDFHAVRSRHWLDNLGSIAPEVLMEELRQEVHSKLEDESQKMGF